MGLSLDAIEDATTLDKNTKDYLMSTALYGTNVVLIIICIYLYRTRPKPSHKLTRELSIIIRTNNRQSSFFSLRSLAETNVFSSRSLAETNVFSSRSLAKNNVL